MSSVHLAAIEVGKEERVRMDKKTDDEEGEEEREEKGEEVG